MISIIMSGNFIHAVNASVVVVAVWNLNTSSSTGRSSVNLMPKFPTFKKASMNADKNPRMYPQVGV